jgi:hypothetical protein
MPAANSPRPMDLMMLRMKDLRTLAIPRVPLTDCLQTGLGPQAGLMIWVARCGRRASRTRR